MITIQIPNWVAWAIATYFFVRLIVHLMADHLKATVVTKIIALKEKK